MVTLVFNIRPVKASGTIYIRADGSINPPTANITTVDNVTYTFTDNINDSIVVERNNIVIDGNGYKLQGMGTGYGFFLNGRNNVTIKETQIAEFEYGVYLNQSLGNTVYSSVIANNQMDGILLWKDSSQNTISNNNITNNNYGISLGYSTNNSILMNDITYNSYGISGSFFSSRNNIIGNTIKDNARNGVEFYGWDFSENLVITENTITNNGWAGIWLVSSANNNTVSDNYIANNGYSGIELHSSSGNLIVNNTMANNVDEGIYLVDSNENTIVRNNITLNHRYGLELFSSSLNTISNNNFVINARTPEAYSTESINNVWDDGYPSGGNYWSNYAGVDLSSGFYQNETGSDGIGDTSYIIDANNTDNYPLMGMFTEFSATSEQHVETICNSTISDLQFNGTAISFNVSGENDTAGFCRVCIPTPMMSTTYKVFVNGTEVSYNLLPCSNESYSYLYFNYTHSTEQVIIIPEFPSILIFPLSFITTLFLAIICKKRRQGGRI
jgi:parallel beta-helix repeat protein